MATGSIQARNSSCLYKHFIEPLRLFYATGRKVLLMFRIAPKAPPNSFYATAALVCFTVSGLAAIGGGLLTSGWLLNAQLHPWLYDLGLMLLIVSLPILILGGHYLDLLDRRQN